MERLGQGRELHIVGDRVLIAPEEGEDRTRVGLYLPATAVESQQVQSGRVVATGPGDPVLDPTAFAEEPWKTSDQPLRHRPMQARIGDVAIFFRKAAVEITYDGEKYLVVPQAAILVLIRDPDTEA